MSRPTQAREEAAMLSICRVSITLTSLVACFALLSPSGAHAKCGKWNLMGGETKGNWLFGQTNGGDMRISFQQKDGRLEGEAEGFMGQGKGPWCNPWQRHWQQRGVQHRCRLPTGYGGCLHRRYRGTRVFKRNAVRNAKWECPSDRAAIP